MDRLSKIFRILGKVFLYLLILTLIPLDLLLININETLAIGLTAGWLVILIVGGYLIRKKNDENAKSGKVGRVLFCILDLIIFLIMVVAAECNIYWNSEVFRKTNWNNDSGNVRLSREQALNDYDFAMHYLKKIHPLTKDGLPSDVKAQADKVRNNLENMDSISGYELSRELESIFSILNDGHTLVDERYENPHYMKHIYEHKKAGDTAIGINGVTYEEMLVEKVGLVSCETEAYGIRMLKNRTSTIEGLRYLGFDTESDITYNYLTEDGEYVDMVVTSEDFIPYAEYIEYEESVTGEDLDGSDGGKGDNDFVRYEIDEEHSLAIFTLDDCEYNQHYCDKVSEMFEEVYEKNIQNIVVDLRNNPGGSSRVADEFIHYLNVDKYDSWASEMRLGPIYLKFDADTYVNKKKGHGFDGNIYVMTSVISYSSAMDFAMLIQDNGFGKIVGEPCGNLPGSYGEVSSFMLPESGLYMQISSSKWYRIDQSKGDQPIIPDIECDPNDALDMIIAEIKGN